MAGGIHSEPENRFPGGTMADGIYTEIKDWFPGSTMADRTYPNIKYETVFKRPHFQWKWRESGERRVFLHGLHTEEPAALPQTCAT